MLKFVTQKDTCEIVLVATKQAIGTIHIKKNPEVSFSTDTKLNENALALIVRQMKLLRPTGMKRLRKFEIKEILKHIGKKRWKTWANKNPIWVGMKSQRMLLLGRSQKCVCCGLTATHFWLEHSGCRSPHLNMYGMKGGKEIMLTCDHVIPRSKGGHTCIDNLQLLCSCCNSAKANHCMTLEELRKKVGLQTPNP
jgi:hypothetical protein